MSNVKLSIDVKILLFDSWSNKRTKKMNLSYCWLPIWMASESFLSLNFLQKCFAQFRKKQHYVMLGINTLLMQPGYPFFRCKHFWNLKQLINAWTLKVVSVICQSRNFLVRFGNIFILIVGNTANHCNITVVRYLAPADRSEGAALALPRYFAPNEEGGEGPPSTQSGNTVV